MSVSREADCELAELGEQIVESAEALADVIILCPDERWQCTFGVGRRTVEESVNLLIERAVSVVSLLTRTTQPSRDEVRPLTAPSEVCFEPLRVDQETAAELLRGFARLAVSMMPIEASARLEGTPGHFDRGDNRWSREVLAAFRELLVDRLEADGQKIRLACLGVDHEN